MNDNVAFLLYGHGGYGNRGCEAIVRTTADLLKRGFPKARTTLASLRPDSDSSLSMPNVDDYVTPARADVTLFGRAWATRTIAAATRRREWVEHIDFRHLSAIGGRSSVSLSIGGDNYCYGPPHWLYAINSILKRSGTPLVLWGASIEPSAIDARMLRDLRSYDVICARESLTVDALSGAGIAESVQLYPDPAFTMQPRTLPLPDGWSGREILGLNVSPLVMRHEPSPGIALRAVRRLMKHVLATTEMSILLVPHVTWDHDNDFPLLCSLRDDFKESDRVAVVGSELTAPEYKGYVAQCTLFIGARTHATIAAYSTGVPTVVLGYSVKARGIARDLLGDEELVEPVQRLNDDAQWVRAFERLRERRVDIKNRLEAVIPGVVRRSTQAVDAVRALVV